MKCFFSSNTCMVYFVTAALLVRRGARCFSGIGAVRNQRQAATAAISINSLLGSRNRSIGSSTQRFATVASAVVEKDEPIILVADADSSNRPPPSPSSSIIGSTVVVVDHKDFVTPERDPRTYRAIRLANNLNVLLVCDEMTSGVGVEAASVHVQAGHFDDTIPGLARTYLLLDEFRD
jgi:hypothetical protein